MLESVPKRVGVKISPDKMLAWVVLGAYDQISPSEVMEALADAGVCYGINNERIEQLCLEHRKTSVNYLVAEGNNPIPGEDAKVTYHYSPPDLKPEIAEDGSVDYYNLGSIIQVEAGQFLASIRPGTEGEPGYNVLGQSIEPKAGKPGKFEITKGIMVKGYSAIAEYDGALTWHGGKLGVTRLQVINGDVNFNVGNLQFPGKIIITGWIRDGFKVEAEEDIEVRGGIENASAISYGGSVFVHQGINGRGGALVKAQKNVEARYVQEAQVEAGEDVVVNEYVLRSNIKAGQALLLQGRRGKILGYNDIMVGSRVLVNSIQSDRDLNLVVKGFDRRALFRELNNLKEEMQSEEDRVRFLADKIRELARDQNPDNLEVLRKLLPTYNALLEKIEKSKEEIAKINNTLRLTKGEGMIKVKDRVHHATSFRIKNDSVELNRELRDVTMYYDANERRIIIVSA
ncbi:MAG: DUF342 domain-containing protein [Deltaproteobacteria bacterium]